MLEKGLLLSAESGPSGLVLPEQSLGQLNVHPRRCSRGPRGSGVGVAGAGASEASWMLLLQPSHSQGEGSAAVQALLLLHPTRFRREACAPSDEPPVRTSQDFPTGAVDKSLSANAGDTGSIPGLGRSQMLRSS